jgi:hypothetical protein
MTQEDLKRRSRMTAAVMAVGQADRFIAKQPNATAIPVIKELRLVIQDLLTELTYLESSRLATTGEGK